MKTKVTLKVEAGLLREARALAAEAGTSISTFLSEQLGKAVQEYKGYSQARRRALNRLQSDLISDGRLLDHETNCMSGEADSTLLYPDCHPVDSTSF